MKINFLVTAPLALSLVLASCDEGSELAGGSDAGNAPDVTRGTDSKTAPCVVPSPKYPVVTSTGASVVGTVPRDGYRIVSAEFTPEEICYVSAGLTQPTNCQDPVDGYGDGKSSWCCVNVRSTSDPKVVQLVSPTLSCAGSVKDLLAPMSGVVVPGDVALCTSSGVFLGWACEYK